MSSMQSTGRGGRSNQSKCGNRRLLQTLAVAASAASAVSTLGANIAPFGTGIIGINNAVDADAGNPHSNSGTAGNINDQDEGTRVDTFFGFGTGDQGQGVSFVGILWPTKRYEQLDSVTLDLATFTDGGWFGANGVGPVPGEILLPEHLIEPTVQVTHDGGTNWTTISHTSDYMSVMSNHGIGGGANANPTLAAVTFTLTEPPVEVDGIRVIGQNGGAGDGNGFIAIWEMFVEGTPSADTDGDGLPDNWEQDNGFNIGTNEGAGDPDSDGLPNTAEYTASTDPRDPDSDDDGLNDGDEINSHLTNARNPDTDGDGLSDGDEVNTHSTDPTIADSDFDNLSDGEEIDRETNPLEPDTDFDGYTDALEVAQGSDPTNALSIPNNLSLLGRGIMGVKDSLESGPETEFEFFHVGTAENLNDGNPTTRVDTYNEAATSTVSYVGIAWDSPITSPIATIDVTFATFLDGGWFGPNGMTPGPGTALAQAHLTEPLLQITTDGFTWTTIPADSDYVDALTGHRIGGGAQPNPTFVKATFTPNTPPNDILGIRVIGTEGGTASGGFIGISEFSALTATADADNDRMDDSWERQHDLDPTTDDSALDPDNDSLTNLAEYEAETDPQNADSDGDGLNDGAEGTRGTNPLRADTDADGLSDGDEVNTHSTDPTKPDSDSDGYQDGVEVAQGTDPASNTSFPNNLAPRGTGIIGTSESIEFGPERPWANSGSVSAINDFNFESRVDTFNGAEPGVASYVGIIWNEPVTQPITELELKQAIFFDGGWFGIGGVGPGSGSRLSATEHLLEPIVQVTTDKGTNWTTVAHTSDYMEALNDHPLPAVNFGAPTTATSTFQLSTPQTGINGIRIIGSEGGQASGGFLGVFELIVRGESSEPSDLRAINSAFNAGQFSFGFNTETGVSYLIQYKNSLSDETWQTLTTVEGDGTVNQATDAAAGEQRFYRISAQ